MLSWDHKSRINEHIDRVARKMGGFEHFDANTPEEKTRIRRLAAQAVLPDYINRCQSFEMLREFMACLAAGDFEKTYPE